MQTNQPACTQEVRGIISNFFSKIAAFLTAEGFEIIQETDKLEAKRDILQFSVFACCDISLIPDYVPEWELGGFNDNFSACWWIEISSPHQDWQQKEVFTPELMQQIIEAAK